MNATVGYRPEVTDRMRPWLDVSFAGVTARWWLGVFLPETPETIYGTEPLKWTVTAYDFLSMLNKPIPKTRMVPTGVNVVAEIRQLLVDAEFPAEVLLDSSRADAVTDAPQFIPADGRTTWIDVLDELLGSISYRAAWMDWHGRLRLGPYLPVADRSSEHTFEVGNNTTSITTDTPKIVRDVYRHPNRWTFVARGISSDPIEGISQYTVNNTARGESSQRSLGRVNEEPPITLSVASYEDLVVRGDAEVDRRIRATSTIDMTGRLFPRLWLDDVATYLFKEQEYPRIACQHWTMQLNGTQQMTSTWEVAQ